ncbi:MAG: hypothetical protein ACOYI6_10070 [Christensenellales bacterium]|jgi:catechol-2,3-dioxygenase
MIQAQPLIAVNNVRASAAFYEALLGVKSAHGGEEYEQLVAGDQLILQLHNCEEDAHHAPLRDLDVPPGN